jgi:hypothetical protein
MYYYIIPFASVTPEMVAVSEADSIETLRHSINPPDRVVMRVSDLVPEFSGFSPIDESTLRTILDGPDWSTPTPIDLGAWGP